MKTPKLILSLCLLFILFSCSNTSEIKTPGTDDFKHLVQSYTNGNISVGDEVLILFYNDIKGARQGDVLPDGIVKLSPDIKGTAYWRDERTLAYKPEKHLAPDQKYVLSFKAGFVSNEKNSDTETYQFTFHTIKQDLSVRIGNLISQGEMYRLQGVILTSDIADNQDVEKIISFDDEVLNDNIKWDHYSNENKHIIYVDSIQRVEENRRVRISYNGSPIGVNIKKSIEVTIPGLNTFKLISTKVEQSPSQLLIIEFSDPVNQQQDLTGLVRIQGVEKLKISRNQNLLKIYTSKRIIGNKLVRINSGLKNDRDYSLKKDIEINVNFEPLKPNVRFVQSGVIIPDNGDGCVMPFEAVNLSAVDLYVIKIFEENIPWFLQVNQLGGDNNLTHFGRLLFKKKIQLISNKVIDHGTWNAFSLNLNDLIKTEPGALYRIEFRF